MKVILEGEERVVNTVIRENRVRVSRGLVSFSPADSPKTPKGVSDEDVEKMGDAIESMMDSLAEKDAQIAKLQEENAALKAALEEKAPTDAPEDTDTKGEGDNGDSKEVPEEDAKDAPEGDSKEVPEEDAKGKKRSKK